MKKVIYLSLAAAILGSVCESADASRFQQTAAEISANRQQQQVSVPSAPTPSQLSPELCDALLNSIDKAGGIDSLGITVEDVKTLLKGETINTPQGEITAQSIIKAFSENQQAGAAAFVEDALREPTADEKVPVVEATPRELSDEEKEFLMYLANYPEEMTGFKNVTYMVERFQLEPKEKYNAVRFEELRTLMDQKKQNKARIDRLREFFERPNARCLATIFNGLESESSSCRLSNFDENVQKLIKAGVSNAELLANSNAQQQCQMDMLVDANFQLILDNYDTWEPQQAPGNVPVVDDGDDDASRGLATAANPETQRSSDEEDNNSDVQPPRKKRATGKGEQRSTVDSLPLPTPVPVVQSSAESTDIRETLITNIIFTGHALGVDVSKYKSNYRQLSDEQLKKLKDLVKANLPEFVRKYLTNDERVDEWIKVKKSVEKQYGNKQTAE